MTQTDQDTALLIAGKSYHSRLLVGTGKYKDNEETRLALEASGAEIITIAIRRTNIGQNPDEPNLLDALPLDKYTTAAEHSGAVTPLIMRSEPANWGVNYWLGTRWLS